MLLHLNKHLHLPIRSSSMWMNFQLLFLSSVVIPVEVSPTTASSVNSEYSSSTPASLSSRIFVSILLLIYSNIYQVRLYYFSCPPPFFVLVYYIFLVTFFSLSCLIDFVFLVFFTFEFFLGLSRSTFSSCHVFAFIILSISCELL